MQIPSSPGPRWWQWPTVLSLDAPAVALLWQWQLAHVAQSPLRWPHAAVLGSSVWLAYAADRWIEGWRLPPERTRTQRHRFYQRHRWPVAFVWLLVFAADLAIAFTFLTARELGAGFLLLAPVLAYLLSHQLVHRHHRWRAPKEICVAGLLAGGVALFPAAQPGAHLHPLALPLCLFTLLCFANCALIAAWEQDVDATHGQTSLAHQFAHGPTLARSLPWLLLLLAALSSAFESGSARHASVAALVSAILLGVVDRFEPRLGWPAARVLADVALLTPLAALLASAFAFA